MKVKSNMTNEELVQLIKSNFEVKENMGILYGQNKGYIYRIAKQYSNICDVNELMQEAYFGLQNAVDSYEYHKGCSFISYAAICIRRVLSMYARNNSYIQVVPGYLVSLISKYNRFKSEYKVINGGAEPSKNECMEVLNLTEKRYNSLLKAIEYSNCISMEQTIPGTEGLTLADTIECSFNVEDYVINRLCDEDLSCIVWSNINKLNTKYRDVIIKRYINNMSITKIAEQYDVPKNRIKKVEIKAVNRLKREFDYVEIGELLLWGKQG